MDLLKIVDQNRTYITIIIIIIGLLHVYGSLPTKYYTDDFFHLIPLHIIKSNQKKKEKKKRKKKEVVEEEEE